MLDVEQGWAKCGPPRYLIRPVNKIFQLNPQMLNIKMLFTDLSVTKEWSVWYGNVKYALRSRCLYIFLQIIKTYKFMYFLYAKLFLISSLVQIILKLRIM